LVRFTDKHDLGSHPWYCTAQSLPEVNAIIDVWWVDDSDERETAQGQVTKVVDVDDQVLIEADHI
jgi:hypothetical protein